MDALKFVKERSRMCRSYGACDGCPLEGAKCSLSTSTSDEEYEKIIATVEQWSKEHPRKTRQSVFLEQFPEAAIDNDGYPVLNPCGFYKNMIKECIEKSCSACRREFWMQEVE